MEVRKALEKILRTSIEDVREELNKKRNDNYNIYKSNKKTTGGNSI